ncbi:MAG: hypothetical protein J6U28_08950 [Bacteroidales bacterium]|nr:hypothetical protein [Bacteroidales bacterium]
MAKRIFRNVDEFEKFFSHGFAFSKELTEIFRKNQEAKNICDRRFHRWCDEHNVPETYDGMVMAIEDFYNDLEAKQNRDEYDEWNLDCWKKQLNGEWPDAFVPLTDEDEDASD